MYYGEKFPELGGRLHLRRLFDRPDLGDEARRHEAALAQGTGHPENPDHRLRPEHTGEILICDHSPTGGLYTLERESEASSRHPSSHASSATADCSLEVKAHRMKPGVIPYSVNAPFWSDGMHKERFLALPGSEAINYTKTRGWNFPDKTVIVKSFALDQEEGNPASRKWIETRFLTKHKGNGSATATCGTMPAPTPS